MSLYETNPEELVRATHPYRKILTIIDFDKLCEGLDKECYSRLGKAGYYPVQGFKMLFLQYDNDLSDRELEECIADSTAAKYFCGFSLTEQSPDHGYFEKLKERWGTKRIADLFNKAREAFVKAGLVREIYSFVDSSKLKAKADTWAARDKALADYENDEKDDDGNPTMNNKNVSNYLSDPEARYGAKGKKDIWIGYKRHVCVDMHQGIITKVAVTAANVHDGNGVKHVLPRQGAVLADKAYSGGEAQKEMKRRGLHSMVIKPNNSKTKNRDQDRFISALRMPYEGVFSKQSKEARFRGKVKLQFQAIMEAFVHNIKRAVTLDTGPLPIT